MNRIALISLLATSVPTQDQASTLASLTDRATAIVRVRALSASRAGTVTRVVFSRQQLVKGDDCPTTFELTEPAGRSCGRALHGVVPGASYVVFLSRATPPTLCTSTSRSIVAIAPGLLEHLQRLATGDDRIAALAQALGARHDRIRRDAAGALALEPGLRRATAAARGEIERALRRALDGRDLAAPALLIATARLGAVGSLDLLVPAYLQASAPELGGALLDSFRHFEPDAVVRRVAGALPADSDGRARAVQILELVPSAAATDLLVELVSTSSRRVARQGGAALLRTGMRAEELEGLAGAELAAECRELCRPRRPVFRSIRVGGRR